VTLASGALQIGFIIIIIIPKSAFIQVQFSFKTYAAQTMSQGALKNVFSIDNTKN